MGNIFNAVKLAIGLLAAMIGLAETSGEPGASKKAKVMDMINAILAALPLTGLAASLVKLAVPPIANIGIEFLLAHPVAQGALADMGKSSPEPAKSSAKK